MAKPIWICVFLVCCVCVCYCSTIRVKTLIRSLTVKNEKLSYLCCCCCCLLPATGSFFLFFFFFQYTRETWNARHEALVIRTKTPTVMSNVVLHIYQLIKGYVNLIGYWSVLLLLYLHLGRECIYKYAGVRAHIDWDLFLFPQWIIRNIV